MAPATSRGTPARPGAFFRLNFLLPISWIAWPAPLHYEIVKHPSRRVRVMANAPRGAVLRHLRALFGVSPAAEASDARLGEQFAERGEESAFAELLRRHGPMVLGVCRRVLHNEHDAEDAFQATFLLLARRAGGIRKPASVGSWLHGVAQRLA